jgi:hypothetical protein
MCVYIHRPCRCCAIPPVTGCGSFGSLKSEPRVCSGKDRQQRYAIIEYISASSARAALECDGVLVDGVKVSVEKFRGK